MESPSTAQLTSLSSALARGGPDLAAMAAELNEFPDRCDVVVKRARARLLSRLSCHSDDFAATGALRALDDYSAQLRFDAQPDSEPFVRLGLSGIDRMRTWRPRRSATVRTKPR